MKFGFIRSFIYFVIKLLKVILGFIFKKQKSGLNSSKKNQKFLYHLFMNKKVLLTTPIFYANREPHIGAALTVTLADFLKRTLQMIGQDVFLSVGTDEHGDKVAKTAKENGYEPKEWVDLNARKFREVFDKLGVSYDKFIRTTDEEHIKFVQNYWNDLVKKGKIYKGTYEGYYSITDETFFSKEELVDGKAPTGSSVQYSSFSCYFLKTSSLSEQMKDFLENNDFTFPSNRINELKGFIKEGVKDICISRPNATWGIDVPGEKNEKIYVWIDALLNYLTVINYKKENPESLERISNAIHLVGKDILTFHGIHWPLLLMLNDVKCPNKIFVHNWWIVDNKKMSKSIGNIVDPIKLIEKYGVDAVRFYFIKENLITSDREFSEEELLVSYNNFLVNKFSNLVYRLTSLAYNKRILPSEGYEIKFEKSLRSIIPTLNIQKYMEEFFAWCDDLNQRIELHRVWENFEYIPDLLFEMYELIKYAEPIVPSIQDLQIQDENEEFDKPIMFFKKIVKS